MSDSHAILWRRLDTPGHDACHFIRDGRSWTIKGTAVFLDAMGPCRLHYHVVCDLTWRTLEGEVSGWTGGTRRDLAIRRQDDGRWRVNGSIVPKLDGLLDLDLGFTPATNTPAIKRLHLDTGRKADAVAAWVDTDDWTVKPLEQSYERLDARTLMYESPDHGYRDRLVTDGFGLIVQYPGLWSGEQCGQAFSGPE